MKRTAILDQVNVISKGIDILPENIKTLLYELPEHPKIRVLLNLSRKMLTENKQQTFYGILTHVFKNV